ncbi:hypothetical protein CSIM01_07269 [Colletotrichum simmondsii]|uniref:Uncharacterized protein n=1 Tax=Colletotrichum simmondsii TaxID=703756 RepID=A0A135TPJ1_9PEZI|nr:hypothetical protein CSIM01_07269 [Colletotrichum simmondsii]
MGSTALATPLVLPGSKIAMPLEKELSGAPKCLSTGTPYFQNTVSSDSEREIMSSQLTNSLGSKAAGKVLAEIDTASKTSESEKAFSILKGPFGAFKSVKRREVPPIQLSPSPTLSEHDTSLLVDPEHGGFQPQTDLQEVFGMNWSEDELGGSFQSFLGCLDLLDGYITVPATNAVETDKKLATSHADAAAIVTISPASSCLGASASLSKVPEQAQALLRYYKSHVGSTKTSGQGKFKSAWQLLFLPCAFETFAELVIAEATYPFWDSESESDRTSLPEFEAIASDSFHIREESLNTGLDPNEEKSETVGYTDIHLESQGLWRETLHSNIHGIPESLMTLLAQTIQLSNEKDHLETRARSNPKLASNLKTHVKTLEGRIWTWSIESEISVLSVAGKSQTIDNEGNLITQPSTQSMVQAMHRALIIYFYRQIYDVSAMLLQNVIHQALGHLESCLDSMVRGDDFALGIAWTVYICARESISPELQERALKCVNFTDARGLHLTSKPSAEALSLLWEKRKPLKSSIGHGIFLKETLCLG